MDMIHAALETGNSNFILKHFDLMIIMHFLSNDFIIYFMINEFGFKFLVVMDDWSC